MLIIRFKLGYLEQFKNITINEQYASILDI